MTVPRPEGESAAAPQPVPRSSRPARPTGDPDKFIRLVKGGQYQARPYDLGERYDLGLFATRDQARKAIQEFWWGKRPSLPRHVKKVRGRNGDTFHAAVRVSLGAFATREEAAAAVEKVVRVALADRADELLGPRPSASKRGWVCSE